MSKIITIVGPTGVGKTKLSIELAKYYNAEIINADSTQIYRELDIATAKVKEEEKEGITHHLLSFKEPGEDYSVFDYQNEARGVLNKLSDDNKNIIIVGGSGLYIKALLYDYSFNSEEYGNYKIDLNPNEMYDKLKGLNLAIEFDINNHQRLTRAYIKYVINKGEEPNKEKGNTLMYNTEIIGLTVPRDVLYDMINKRADKMIEEGLLIEAKEILTRYSNSRIVNTIIGYKEFIPYFNNEIGLEECINKLKQNSRKYAKRQYTWFKNKMDVKWFDTDYNNFNNTIKDVIEYLEGRL